MSLRHFTLVNTVYESFRGEGFENSQKRMNQLVVSCIMCEQRSTRRGNVKEHKELHHEDHFILVITAEMNHGGKLVSKLTRGQCTHVITVTTTHHREEVVKHLFYQSTAIDV